MNTMSRDELGKCKSRELAKMLSDLGVKGSWEMKKADIIDRLMEMQGNVVVETIEVPEVPVVKEQPIEDVVPALAVSSGTEVDNGTTYVESAEIGMIVAFKTEGKTKSAKIVKKSTNKRKFMLETAYGATYIVSYEDIVWVKTGNRWPRGVYMALKGLQEAN